MTKFKINVISLITKNPSRDNKISIFTQMKDLQKFTVNRAYIHLQKWKECCMSQNPVWKTGGIY